MLLMTKQWKTLDVVDEIHRQTLLTLLLLYSVRTAAVADDNGVG